MTTKKHTQARPRSQAREPKDKRTAAWRNWKLREFRRHFTSPTRTTAAYTAAWAEYKSLLNGLLANEDFWHVRFALALLPHLLTARQELAALAAYERRMQAGIKGAETRKRKLARQGKGRCCCPPRLTSDPRQPPPPSQPHARRTYAKGNKGLQTGSIIKRAGKDAGAAGENVRAR